MLKPASQRIAKVHQDPEGVPGRRLLPRRRAAIGGDAVLQVVQAPGSLGAFTQRRPQSGQSARLARLSRAGPPDPAATAAKLTSIASSRCWPSPVTSYKDIVAVARLPPNSARVRRSGASSVAGEQVDRFGELDGAPGAVESRPQGHGQVVGEPRVQGGRSRLGEHVAQQANGDVIVGRVARALVPHGQRGREVYLRCPPLVAAQVHSGQVPEVDGDVKQGDQPPPERRAASLPAVLPAAWAAK